MTSYHHGNLREALLTEARKQLIEFGPDKLSLRALARAVGVSQTAPYRHFPDKKALLEALTIEVFKEFNAAVWTDANKIEDANQRLIEVALAYIEFACDHQALYRFMFGPLFSHRFDHPELREVTTKGLGSLYDTLQEVLSTDDPDTVWNAVISCRALVHGLATMRMDGGIVDQSPLGGQFDLRKAVTFMQQGLAGMARK